MKKLIENCITYPTITCLLGTVQNYMRYCGIDIDESDIFFSGSGYNIVYNKVERSNGVHTIFVAEWTSIVRKFFQKYNITNSMVCAVDDEQAEEILLRRIYNNSPVIIRVDTNCLNYNTIFRQSTTISHYIMVLGTNLDEGQVYISDGCVPTIPRTTFSGWIDYNTIKKARKIKKNDYLNLEKKSVIKAFSGSDIKSEMPNLIKNNLLLFLNGTENQERRTGILAVREFEKDFWELLCLCDEKYSDKITDMIQMMKVCGFISSKILLYNGLKKISNSMCISWCDELIDIYRKWNNMLFILAKVRISRNREDIIRLCKMVENLNMREIKLYSEIVNVL